ncbi:MAG: lipid asymmetry maintenance protein MlaB [Aestuariibacter sp.]
MTQLQIKQESDSWQLVGELSIETVPEAEKRSNAFLGTLGKNGRKTEKLVISFENVAKVDTAGLAWLLNFTAALRKSGTDVKVAYPPEALLKLSRLSNAEELVFGEQPQD